MNDIDLLMSKPVLDLTPIDIDAIVAYHRQQRAGGKAEAAKATRKAQIDHDIDIAAIMQTQLGSPPPPKTQIARRKIT